ncbi:MAG: prepilin peptidase [Chloroflexi bacterium]|nr:MAG: prepilin peptidase [Chloroflexota bacterium]
MGRPGRGRVVPLGGRAGQRHAARPSRGDAAAAGRPATARRGHRPRLRHRRHAARAQSAFARPAYRGRLGRAALPGGDRVPAVDGKTGSPRGDAGHSATVNQDPDYLIALLWAVVGAAGGWLVRWGSVKLARLEGLEPGNRLWQVYGPSILCAVLFAIYAFVIPPFPILLVRSVFVLVLVQVIFFDFEHRLILDRVMFPSMVLALLVTLSPLVNSRLGLWQQPWWAGIAMGLAAGLLFLLLALAGSALFKAEALGFGDVKLALFMGLLLGWPYTLTAMFYGVFLAGLVSIGVIVWRRSLKGTIAYGPYLAAGAVLMLVQLPWQ